MSNNIVIGILAHVDAGKTTLSEAMLYSAGATDRVGRVDKGDAHLDTYELERERGITIFSKQAQLEIGTHSVTLIDTPGHVDFSTETERALWVQDYAILLISATDGVTAHTRTLWQLLSARHIPTIIFVNKTDISTRITAELRDELCTTLSPRCVGMSTEWSRELCEELASRDEGLMEEYFTTDTLSDDSVAEAVRERRIFPCFFGSALKMRGVSELMSGIARLCRPTVYSDAMLSARVYKVMRDKNGRRMCFAKITGGTLRPKDTLEIRTPDGTVTEKVEELRLYSLDKSRPMKEAHSGEICAILGTPSLMAGMGIGAEVSDSSALTPALSYRLILPEGTSPFEVYTRLGELAEEDPALNIAWSSEKSEISVRLMGEIQLEVLRRLIRERLGLSVEFDEGSIIYKETLAAPVIGRGHFEPLRHYAEVHLLIEPLHEGSGIQADTDCDTDLLSLGWQRLIMTHIEERVHRGRLTGAPLTDLRITLLGGKAHLKHTVGGDFRQATYRAIRQGIMKGESVLLEPTFNFRAELPAQSLGRFLTDLTAMHGTPTGTENDGTLATVTGVCPVATMRSYSATLRAYTRGYGRLITTVGGYAPCHNTEEVVAARGYDPDADERNPAGSVFCKGGAGYYVPWQEADGLMHLGAIGELAEAEQTPDTAAPVPERARSRAGAYTGTAAEDKELMRIFEATYGKVKTRHAPVRTVNEAKPREEKRPPKPRRTGKQYLLVDGYNVIHAWQHLSDLAARDFGLARDTLVREIVSYAAFAGCQAIVVFDAYRVKDGKGSTERCGNTSIVYTKERQTADAYIEKVTYEIAKDNYVRVVTSDMHEQFIILGNGAFRVSPSEFLTELTAAKEEMKNHF